MRDKIKQTERKSGKVKIELKRQQRRLCNATRVGKRSQNEGSKRKMKTKQK